MKRARLIVGLIGALGCGHAEPAHEHEATSGAEAHEGHHAHEGHGSHEDHHANLSPAVRAFHDGFAPHWHGDRSAAAVCPDAANLQALANAAADEQQAHAAAAEEARAAAQSVVDACAAEDHAAFDAALERLHHALHGLMEAQR